MQEKAPSYCGSAGHSCLLPGTKSSLRHRCWASTSNSPLVSELPAHPVACVICTLSLPLLLAGVPVHSPCTPGIPFPLILSKLCSLGSFSFPSHIHYFSSTGSGLSTLHFKSTILLPKPSQRQSSRLRYQRHIHTCDHTFSGHWALTRGTGVTHNFIL